MAYFYFDFRDVDKQNLQNLLPSLLTQLSARSDPRHDILSQLYCTHDHGERRPSDRAMIECLKQMLSLETQGPTFIILDALDECPITSSIPIGQVALENGFCHQSHLALHTRRVLGLTPQELRED